MKHTYIRSARTYYRHIKRELPFCFPQRKAFLRELSAMLDECTAKEPQISYETITERLGTPAAQIQSCAETLGTDSFRHAVRISRMIRGWIIAAAILITGILFGLTQWVINTKFDRTFSVTKVDPVIHYVTDEELESIMQPSGIPANP